MTLRAGFDLVYYYNPDYNDIFVSQNMNGKFYMPRNLKRFVFDYKNVILSHHFDLRQ